MNIDQVAELEKLPLTELLVRALWCTSWAQTNCSESFDKVDRLQEAYVILHEVLTEARKDKQ